MNSDFSGVGDSVDAQFNQFGYQSPNSPIQTAFNTSDDRLVNKIVLPAAYANDNNPNHSSLQTNCNKVCH